MAGKLIRSSSNMINLDFFRQHKWTLVLSLVVLGVLTVSALRIRRWATVDSPSGYFPEQTALVVRLESYEQYLGEDAHSANIYFQDDKMEGNSGVAQSIDHAMYDLSQSLFPKASKQLQTSRAWFAFSLAPPDSLHPLLILEVGFGFDMDTLLAGRKAAGDILKTSFKGHTIYHTKQAEGRPQAVTQSGKYLIYSRYAYLVEAALAAPSSSVNIWNNELNKREQSGNWPVCLLLLRPGMLPERTTTPGSSLDQFIRKQLAWVLMETSPRETDINLEYQRPDRALFASTGLAELAPWIPDQAAWVSTFRTDALIPETNRDFDRFVAPWIGNSITAVGTMDAVYAPEARVCWMLSVRDTALAARSIQAYGMQSGILQVSDYQTFTIWKLLDARLLEPLVGHADIFRNMVCTMAGNYLIASPDRSTLEWWIDKYIVGQTLQNHPPYLQAVKNPKLGGPTVYWGNMPDLKKQLFDYIGAGYFPSGEVYPMIGALQTEGDGFQRIKLIQNKNFQEDQPITTWRLPLQGEPVTPIFPAGKNNDRLMVQDSTGQLYCMDQSGNLIWRKQLINRILSEIHTVSYLGNADAYYLFNTTSEIWLLDQRGTPAQGFPLTLKAGATTGLTLVKGESRPFSMYVPCNNGNIYGFDQLGRPISGWNPLTGTGILKQPLVHLQSKEQDHLLYLNEKNELYAVGLDGTMQFDPVVLPAPVRTMPVGGVYNQKPGWRWADQRGKIVLLDILGHMQEENAPVKAGLPFQVTAQQSDYAGPELIFLQEDKLQRFDAGSGAWIATSIQGFTKPVLASAGNRHIAVVDAGAPRARLWFLGRDLRPHWGDPVSGGTPMVCLPSRYDRGMRLCVTAVGSNLYGIYVRFRKNNPMSGLMPEE